MIKLIFQGDEMLYRGAGCTGNYKEVDSRASRTEAAVTYLYIS